MKNALFGVVSRGHDRGYINVYAIFTSSDFILPFLPPYMGVIPNPKMAFIFPSSCIFALIFPLFMKFFPKCEGKGSSPKSQIKSLTSDSRFDRTNGPCSKQVLISCRKMSGESILIQASYHNDYTAEQ